MGVINVLPLSVINKIAAAYSFAASNHIPPNVPVENPLHYLGLIERLGNRGRRRYNRSGETRGGALGAPGDEMP